VRPAIIQRYLDDSTDATYLAFVRDPDLWKSERYYSFDLPGPAYEGIVPHLGEDDALDEWVDGPWGTAYSNLGIVDWDGLDRLYGGSLGIVLSEADGCVAGICNKEDFLGAAIVERDRVGLFPPIEARMFGWVQLENVQTGTEPSVDFADVYVFPDWDGTYPVGLTHDSYCNPVDCSSCDSDPFCQDVELSCVDEATVSTRCSLTGSPLGCGQFPSSPSDAQICEAGCLEKLLEPMAEGTPYRPYHDLQSALSNSPPGAIVGIFRGRYATECDTGAPVPMCPGDITEECISRDGSMATYSVSSTGNCYSEQPAVTCDHSSGSVFPLGDTTVQCTATDSAGNSGSCSFTVRIADSQPPTLNVSLDPTVLWPPDHKLAGIAAAVSVHDVCDPNPLFRLTSITSNEADNGLGDGDTSGDIQDAANDTADTLFRLRGERSGRGRGRSYFVTYTAYDRSGNTESATASVLVPSDQGKGK
jgi:hypothetical protein